MNIQVKPQQEPLMMRFFYPLIKYSIGTVIRLLWVGKVTGLENIPRSGAVIVAINHESFFDFMCFVAMSPRRVRFLAGEKLFESYFWLPLMKATGQFKVDRRIKDKTKLRADVAIALSDGQMVGIFPEGTRRRGDKMLKAFTGVAQFALKHKVPIIPVGVNGAYEIMTPYDKYPRLNKRVSLTIGKPISLDEFYDKEHSRELLHDLTDDVMVVVAKLADKEYPHRSKLKLLK